MFSDTTKEHSDDNIFNDSNCEELLKLEEKFENDLIHVSDELHSTIPTQNNNTETILEQQDLKPDINSPENAMAEGEESTNISPDCDISNSTTSTETADASSAHDNIGMISIYRSNYRNEK